MSETLEPVMLEEIGPRQDQQPEELLIEQKVQEEEQADVPESTLDESIRSDEELQRDQSEEAAEQQPNPLQEQEPQLDLRPDQLLEEVPKHPDEQQQQQQRIVGDEEDEGRETILTAQDVSQSLETSIFQGKAIEDEEMPSMLTFDNSSKMDESDVNLKQDERYSPQPMPQKVKEDSDSDSVCVIDDDDDEEEERDGEEEGYSYDDDDDEEDEGSSSYDDDDDDNDEENEKDRNRYKQDYDKRQMAKPGRNVKNDIEDEDEEEDEDDDDDDDDDIEEEEEEEEVEECYREEGAEDDSGPDCFDGGSDDLVLRHSNGLNKEVKERSASLQDLSYSREQNRIRSFNPLSQKARFERNQELKRKPGKFDHVPSKVKKYITDMAEQRRMSNEKRKKAQEEARYKQQEISESQMRRNEEIVMTCKSIKNYTEKTLKEVAEENEQFHVPPQGFDNGEITINFLPKQAGVDNRRTIINQEEMEVDPIMLDEPRNDERLDKVNGTTVNDNQNMYLNERGGIHRRNEYSPKPVLNGEDPNYVSNLRTLSYEEYMCAPSNTEVIEEVLNDERTINQIQNIPEKCNNNESDDPPCILEIDSITSNYQAVERNDDNLGSRKTPVGMISQSTETYYPEINALRLQLEQRNEQFENLRNAYQRTMSDNLAMKMELDNLKKIVAHYEEKERLVPEKKTATIQTDSQTSGQALSMPLIDIDDGDEDTQMNARLAANSITSAASTQWSDSTGSAAISMEPPPSITTALFSDDSATTLGKTTKPKNPFSRAYVTSTRILQTLSNITTGKAKLDRYGKKGSSSKQSVPEVMVDSAQLSQDDKAGPSNSRKRKASDTIEEIAQPFKIPHTSNTNRVKDNSSLEALDSQIGKSNDKDNINNDGANCEQETEQSNNVQESDDDVKIFLYPEDENSKEHNFLIQAKDVDSNPNRVVRECGPYLLGNVEVYMTEVNGTINIWGKELSQGSVSQNIEEMDTSTRSKDLKTELRWQSTPRLLNKNVSASANKKSKIASRYHQQQQSKQHTCDVHSGNTDYEHCDPYHYRTSWPSCSQSTYDHQPCCPRVRIEEELCGCRHKSDKRNAGFAPNCKSHFLDSGRFSLPNVYQEASCCCSNRPSHCRTTATCEDSLKHRYFVRRPSFNPTDDEGESEEELVQHNFRSGHPHKQNSMHSPGPSNEKLAPPGSTRQSNSPESLGCENDNDPLISQKNLSDEPETRKRRLSGKRVRGLLLDLLKGNCGDCKATDSMINTNLHQNASIYEPSTSIQKSVPCSPNLPTCSPRSNQKCSTCRVKRDKAAEIEAQLDYFRTEMDKLNTCSANLRDMFESLRNDATANK